MTGGKSMTTTPGEAASGEQDNDVESATQATPNGAGAEIGIVEGEGSTFEPEEDPEGEPDR